MSQENEFLQSYEFGEWFDSVSVVFFIRSDEFFDPAQISDSLGIKPSRSHSEGELYLSKYRDPITEQINERLIPKASSIWEISTEQVSGLVKVQDHVLYLLNILESVKEKLQIYLTLKTKYTIGICINVEWNWSNEELVWMGYSINSDLLLRLASLSHYIEYNFEKTP